MTRTSSRAPIPSGSRYVVGNRYPSALGASAGTPTLTSKLESSAAARKESRGILSWARARSATSASRRPSRTVKRCSTPRPRSSAATTSDHDSSCRSRYTPLLSEPASPRSRAYSRNVPGWAITWLAARSEEHTSELQSQSNLVCRLLLEKKNDVVRTGILVLQVLGVLPDDEDAHDRLVIHERTVLIRGALYRQLAATVDHRRPSVVEITH